MPIFRGFVNKNQLFIPIKLKKGLIHHDQGNWRQKIDEVEKTIYPPYSIGDIYPEQENSSYRFANMKVSNVCIIGNYWVFYFDEYW